MTRDEIKDYIKSNLKIETSEGLGGVNLRLLLEEEVISEDWIDEGSFTN